MSMLKSIRQQLANLDHILSLLATAVIAAAVLGCVAFVALSLLPQVQSFAELSSQVESAEDALSASQKVQAQSPERLRLQIASAEEELAEAANTFLSEPQAGEALQRLYGYAAESQVEITGMQSQPGPKANEKGLYDIRTFALQAQGSLDNLVSFLSRIQELSSKSYILTNANIVQGDSWYTLAMDVVLYTSPYATAETLPQAPLVVPTVAPTQSVSLEQTLAEAWAAEDWSQAIGLIRQILSLEPAREDMVEKLYAAYVAFGYQLLAAGDLSGAAARFNEALRVKPGGQEALAGLEKTVPAPYPTPATGLDTATHVVVDGDTLYSLAREYGTTVQAIMSANGLRDSTIRVGQRLLIPAQ